MAQTKVPPQAEYHHAVAAELERVAAEIRDLAPGVELYASLRLMPGPSNRDDMEHLVDSVGMCIIGMRGHTFAEGGAYIHEARRDYADRRLSVAVHRQVLPPRDPKDAEIERLKAELAAAQAVAPDAFAFSREVIAPTSGAPIPASVSGMPLGHHGPVAADANTLLCLHLDGGVRCGEPIQRNTLGFWAHVSKAAAAAASHSAVGPAPTKLRT